MLRRRDRLDVTCVVKKLLDQALWGLSQPGLDDQLAEGHLVDLGESDRNGRIAVECGVVKYRLGSSAIIANLMPSSATRTPRMSPRPVAVDQPAPLRAILRLTSVAA